MKMQEQAGNKLILWAFVTIMDAEKYSSMQRQSVSLKGVIFPYINLFILLSLSHPQELFETEICFHSCFSVVCRQEWSYNSRQAIFKRFGGSKFVWAYLNFSGLQVSWYQPTAWYLKHFLVKSQMETET